MTQLTLIQPDDWHIHLRDGAALNTTVPHAAAQFKRAIVMPNLVPPVTTTAAASEYRQRILAALQPSQSFEPLMTLYLTDQTPPQEIHRATQSGVVFGVKLYPAGATTHSAAGVTDIERVYPTLEAMCDAGLPLLVHGEVTDPAVDIFDREKVFIDTVLAPLVQRYPALKLVLEHITTEDAVQFVEAAADTVGATITPHHLLLNRNHMLVGGIRPHHYCLPVVKRERHRLALVSAATGGNPKFFLGTDSAPHPRGAKESACGCAGIYSAFSAIEFYAEAFENAGALDRLEAFASLNGPRFYGLETNRETITLEKITQPIPDTFSFEDDVVIPLRAGGNLSWRIKTE